jgi:SET domain-containing protein
MTTNIPTEIKDGDLSHLYKAKSNIVEAGEGVYSKIPIAKGTIVEKANVMPMPSENVKDTPMMDYVFNNPYKKDEFLIAFGFGSMYNHSDTPHMSYSYCPNQNKLIFTAIKDIIPNEEIYISYGPNWWATRTDKTKIDAKEYDKQENKEEMKIVGGNRNIVKYKIKKL